MKQIGDLLGRFKKYTRDTEEVKQYIQFVLGKHSISLPVNKITVKKYTVFIQGTPIQKQTLFLKQKSIISDLQKHPLTKFISAIR